MFCNYCDAQLRDDSVFCHVCGGKINPKVVKPANKIFNLANGVKLDMVRVSPGILIVGKRNNEKYYNLSQAFYIGKYEVTQAQWSAIMSTTIREQRDKVNPAFSLKGEGDNYPVYYVSWDEAMEFCKKMNNYAPYGWRFTLPTQVLWAFAAKGGSRSRGYKYSGSNKLDDVAWYKNNSGGTTHEVGKKSSNELGLYDMDGNVMEWCLDNCCDTHGELFSSDRIIRGRSFVCSSAESSSLWPRDGRLTTIGFRVVLIRHIERSRS